MLLRALVGLEAGGGNEFFGEPQLAIERPDAHGAGRARRDLACSSCPPSRTSRKLFSTVLMWLLAELFEELPEAGDLDKPKLVFFFDEAHLLFDGATKAFLESVTQTVRLIRSKGVGVFFVTQVPDDVPGDVLGQLGNRVQHALRAFTPDDAKALKAAASTYPTSEFYDVAELLTQMGIGEAAVTMLSDDGRAHPGGAHAAAGARIADGSGRRRGRRRRRRRRCSPSTGRASELRERARELLAGSTPWRSRRGRSGASAATEAAGQGQGAGTTRRRLSAGRLPRARARARRCRARSCAACSGC